MKYLCQVDASSGNLVIVDSAFPDASSAPAGYVALSQVEFEQIKSDPSRLSDIGTPVFGRVYSEAEIAVKTSTELAKLEFWREVSSSGLVSFKYWDGARSAFLLGGSAQNQPAYQLDQARKNLGVPSLADVTAIVAQTFVDALTTAKAARRAAAVSVDIAQGFSTSQIAQGLQNLGITFGSVVLVAGTATVANTAVKSTSKIFLAVAAAGGTQGNLRVTKSAGASFTITSTSGTETSTVDYILILN